MEEWAGLGATAVQVAVDGKWEESAGVEEGGWGWLADHEDVAVEVFFGEALFLGARLVGLAADDRKAFVEGLVEAVGARTFGEAGRFWRLPDGRPLPWDGPPLTLEVGVVNAWRSVGGAVIWRRGEPSYELERVTAALLEAHSTPVALEAAFAGDVPAWTGCSVSRRGEDGLHRLDPSLLRGAAEHFLTSSR